MPVALWALTHLTWAPKTRLAYALRFSLWPLILFSTQLGGPIARHMAGHASRYLMGLEQSFAHYVARSVWGAIFVFGICYLWLLMTRGRGSR